MAVWIVLGVYVTLMAIVGFVSFRKADSLTAFVVGSRSAGPWMSAFGYGTTYFSAVLFIGYAGNSGFNFGLFAILIGVGNAVLGAWLAWKVLAKPTRDVTRRLKIKTMPQFFEARYGSEKMKLYCAVITFIFMVPYSASVYSGLSYLCESVLGIPYQTAMIAIAVVAAVYLVLGGYIATLLADFIQGIVMIVGVAAMIFFITRSQQVGGLANGLSRLWDNMSQTEGMFTVNTAISVISLILLTSIGTWGMPQMVHKFYAIKDEKSVKSGTVISTFFCGLVSCGAYYIGSLSRLFYDGVPTLNGKPNYDLIIPGILVQALPAILLGVVLVLVLSASVSTLSGITLTSCSTFSMDLIAHFVPAFQDRKKTLTLTRVLCLLFIAASFIIASFKSPILTLMSFSWGTITGAFLPPYMLGLYWKGMNRVGAWCSLIGGVAVSLTLAFVTGFQSSLAPTLGVITMLCSFGFGFAGSKLSKNKASLKDTAKATEHFFDKSYSL